MLLEARRARQRRERAQRRPGAELDQRRRRRRTRGDAAHPRRDAGRASTSPRRSRARYAPPGTFRRQGCLEIYTDPRRAEAARAPRRRSCARPACPPSSCRSAGSASRGARGAVLDPLAGRLNGFALLQALRPALVAEGVRVLRAHAACARVRGGAESRSRRRAARCAPRALVLATNAYTPVARLLPRAASCRSTRTCSRRSRSRRGAGRRSAGARWDGFTDDLDRIAYACRTPGGRLVFGGGGNAAYAYRFGGAPVRPRAAGERAARFMRARSWRATSRRSPTSPIAHRWTGTLAITLDRVCSMGVGGEHRNVYYALGYSGHGVALALLAGRVLADLYDGNHEAWRDLPFYQKRLLPHPARAAALARLPGVHAAHGALAAARQLSAALSAPRRADRAPARARRTCGRARRG